MAFGYDGSVRIKADLNHSPFDRGLSSMTKQVDKFSVTLKKLASTVALAFGTAAIINFGKESINLASDIQEVQNVIDVTFGQGAKQIEEFAKSAAEAYGLSELAAKQYTGTMGAMLKSSGLATSAAQEMSIALTGLAGDVASFYNLDTDTAFEKIRSGISGETEPLKQLGINMSVANLEAYALSKGITKSYNAMSQAEQVLLRYNYLLSVTTDAQGDFARTSDSFANQIRILQLNFDQLRIAVGNALIPIAQAVLPGINAIIAALTKLATVFAQVTALLFGKSPEVKATSGIASSAGAAADATDKLADATEGAGGAAKQAAKDMKGVLAGFDELNILADNAAGSVGDAAGGLDLGGLGAEVSEMWGDASVNPKLTAEIYAMTEKLKEMIPLIAGIGAGLLAWKVANNLIPDLGLLKGLLGSLMVTAGVTLLVDSIQDIIFGAGLTWKNILEGAAGGALAGAGLGLMFANKLGLTWAHGMLGGAVIGLGVSLIVESIADIIVRGLNIGNGILGAIGGAIAGAAAGFLYMGGPGGAILGASIGVGISLVLESIADIISSGLNLKNGAVGLIGGALAGAGIGFYLGGPGGAVLGAIIGVGLTFTVEGVVSQIASGVSIFGAIATIIGTALTGAGIGFVVGGPAGAGVGAVFGLIAGVVLEITGVTAAGEAVYRTTEDFQTMKRVIDECEDSANRSSFAMKTLSDNVNNLTSSLSDIGAAQQLVDEIYAINENANASAYELEMMATKVELLNSMGLDGLHLSIDETTGRIVETKEATDQLIASLQKEAETAALQELIVQAYKDRYQAVADAEKAVKNVTVAEQALAETERELTNTPWWDLRKHAALTAQQEKQTEALEAATEARDKAITAYDELSGAIDTYSGALTGLKEPESGVGVKLEERMNSVRQTLDGVSNDMPQYGRNIGGNLATGLFNGLDENMSPVEKLFSDLWNSIKTDSDETWGDVQHSWDGSSTWFEKNVKNPIGDLFSKLWDGVKRAATDAWSNIQRTFSNVGNWFSNNVTSKLRTTPTRRTVSYSLPETTAYSLPRLANGAVIPPNQQFAAVLGDQRSGMNIEAPLKTIEQAVRNVMGESGFDKDIVINLTAEMDGNVVTKTVVRRINSMTRSSGKSPLYA